MMTKGLISNSGTEESGRLQFMGLQSTRHHGVTKQKTKKERKKEKEKAEMIKWFNK